MTDTGEPGSEGRPATPHELVRPYVLSAGGSAGRSPAQRDAGESRMRGDQPGLDWTGDLHSRRTHDAQFESTRPGEPPGPRPATAPLPALKSAGSHRALQRGRRQAVWLGWLGLLAERRWLAAIGASVAALAIVGGMILLLSRPPSRPSRPISRSQPAMTHTPARHSPTPTRTHPTPNPSRSSPAPTSTPSPSSTPTASPTKKPVKVSYVVVRQHPHTFQGQFAIVNNGSTAVNGWELVVVLPGDRIRTVWDGSFHTNGDTLYIDPPRSQRAIAPGATVTENFTAHGSTTTLTSCTFNGSAC